MVLNAFKKSKKIACASLLESSFCKLVQKFVYSKTGTFFTDGMRIGCLLKDHVIQGIPGFVGTEFFQIYILDIILKFGIQQ